MAFAALIGPACGQAKRRPGSITFTAADGNFRFSYPKYFKLCAQGEVDPCLHTYIPICESNSLVCIATREKQFAGTTLAGVSFEVRDIESTQAAMTADVCVTPTSTQYAGGQSWPDFLISAEHPAERIGGVLFVHGVSGDAALGHSRSVDLYRTFHLGKCFELSISEAGIGATFEPPLKSLTKAQRRALDETESQIVHSFRFLK